MAIMRKLSGGNEHWFCSECGAKVPETEGLLTVHKDWCSNTSSSQAEQDSGSMWNHERLPSNFEVLHVSRSFDDLEIENNCSCGKAPCGYVDLSRTDNTCDQHPAIKTKTMRRMHRPEACPALKKKSPPKPSPLLMRSVPVNHDEMAAILNLLISDERYYDREYTSEEVAVIIKLAMHVRAKDPLAYVPIMNRSAVEHEWVPSMLNPILCDYCERTFSMSNWHKK